MHWIHEFGQILEINWSSQLGEEESRLSQKTGWPASIGPSGQRFHDGLEKVIFLLYWIHLYQSPQF